MFLICFQYKKNFLTATSPKISKQICRKYWNKLTIFYFRGRTFSALASCTSPNAYILSRQIHAFLLEKNYFRTILMTTLFQSHPVIFTPQKLSASSNLFLPRVKSSSGKCSIFVSPKVWPSILDFTTFTHNMFQKHLLLRQNK